MNEISPIRARARAAIVPLMALCAIAYFGYHSVVGDHGLLAWLDLRERAATLETELSGLKAERRLIEKRVALLRPESLDPDLLEERAMKTLGYTNPNDITIFRPR